MNRTDIGDVEVLFDLAESAGMSRNDAAAVLAGGHFRESVDHDWMRSLKFDPKYVPAVLLNGELLENPREYDRLELLLARHGVRRR